MRVDVDPREELRRFVKQYRNIRLAAAALDVTNGYVSQMLRGACPVGPKVLHQLGLRRTVIMEDTKAS